MKLFLLLILLVADAFAATQGSAVSLPQQRKPDDPFILENEEKRSQNPPTLVFTIRLKVQKAQFHQGEIINLELSFSSSTAKTFILDLADYDRSGRLEIDAFVLDRRDGTADPLYDYFNSGFGFVGGGLRGFSELSDKPDVISVELNEWIRFDKPGHYRLYVVSGRVGKKQSPDDRYGRPKFNAVSNVVEFEILPANDKWATQRLNEAAAALAKQDSQRAACRTLRFLGTRAAVSQMIGRLRENDKGCDSQYQFGLIGSPHRDFVIREMERALNSSEQPITSSFVRTLALLAFTSQATPFPAYPEGNDEQIKQWQARMEQRRNFHNQIVLDYLRQLVAAIPQKQEAARATSLQTLLDYQESLKKSDLQLQSLLATMPEVFNRLSLDAQTHLLTYQWKPIATSAMLPVLREILKQPYNKDEAYQQRQQRSIALRRLYELSPVEGRSLILDEIGRLQPRINLAVLRSLPDETLPELDDLLATNLEQTHKSNGSGDAEVISDLIERYATAAVLARVRAVYESPGVGRWACRIQASLLAYILRTDPPTGAELLSKALAARGKNFTRCYTSTLSDIFKLSELRMSAEVEEVASAALEESDPEIVSQAASVLGHHGSAAAEDRLWQRLQKWHQEMGSQADALSIHNPGKPEHGGSVSTSQAMIEASLRNALSHGSAWLADLEKLKRLRALCLTHNCRDDVDSKIRGWNQQIHVAVNSFEDKPYLISVAHYQLNSLKSLKQKLLQFPRGTLFTWGSGRDSDDPKTEEVFKEFKSYLEEHGMKLERRNNN